MKIAHTFYYFIVQALISFIIMFRPFLGPATCRFYGGCTAYAIEQLQILPLHKALWNIGKRLLQCNPFW